MVGWNFRPFRPRSADRVLGVRVHRTEPHQRARVPLCQPGQELVPQPRTAGNRVVIPVQHHAQDVVVAVLRGHLVQGPPLRRLPEVPLGGLQVRPDGVLQPLVGGEVDVEVDGLRHYGCE
jgi:hypothetical protein